MEATEKDIEILREYTKREYAPIILLDRLVKSVQEKCTELYKNESGKEKEYAEKFWDKFDNCPEFNFIVCACTQRRMDPYISSYEAAAFAMAWEKFVNNEIYSFKDSNYKI